jgi:ribosomal protein S18 acetylase RimI-like enzyme
MHVLNTVGLKFYEACGFTVDQRLDNYYTDLEEPHCFILLKAISHPHKEDQKP